MILTQRFIALSFLVGILIGVCYSFLLSLIIYFSKRKGEESNGMTLYGEILKEFISVGIFVGITLSIVYMINREYGVSMWLFSFPLILIILSVIHASLP